MQSYISSMYRQVQELARDRRGNVMMIFALACVPLVIAIGAAIDYSQAARSRTHIQEASNVAALAAERVAQSYLNTNGTGSAQWATAVSLAQAEMTQVFSANEASDTYSQGATPVLNLTQASDGTATANVSATANAPTAFMQIIGIKAIPVSAFARATGAANTYYQIVFVVDVSSSMGIGGTPADINALVQNPMINCAFACHDAKNYDGYEYVTASYYCYTYPNDSNCAKNLTYSANSGSTWTAKSKYYDKRALAAKYGYKLKIDYINSAIQTFVSQLQPYMTKAPNLFSVSMWTFGTSTTQIQAPTNDASALQTAASSIDVEIPVTQAENFGYTYTTSALNTALKQTPNMGDGSSATRRKTYFVLLSDGAEDLPNPSSSYRTVDVNYTSACTTMKQPAISGNPNSSPVIFSIEASYSPILSGRSSDQYKASIADSGMATAIPTAMQNCATASSDYFKADDGPAIQSAVQSVFSNIFATNLYLSK